MLTARDVHCLLGRDGWRNVLASLGVPESALSGRKNIPCPACGGTDRFTFDNRSGRGDFFCRGCGAGKGFELLMRLHGWEFPQAFHAVIEVARLDPTRGPTSIDRLARVKTAASQEAAASQSTPSRPTGRALDLLRASCAIDDCDAIVKYLRARHVWPLPPEHGLRAHVACEYFDNGHLVGRYAALLATVMDIDGVLASLHVTYIDKDGRKLSTHPPRKLLGKLEGHRGCAVPLMRPNGPELAIAEGIETALSAYKVGGKPTWAALNTALLAKFEPPPSVHRLHIYADRDAAGLEAAIHLREHLEGRCDVETHIPPAPFGDWNDHVVSKAEAAK